MGILGALFERKKQQPLSLLIRDTLFGDIPLEKFPPEGTQAQDFPWSVFAAGHQHLAAGNKAKAAACWRQIADQVNLESRLRLQAWHFLRMHGETPPPEIAKQVWGIVVEVGMPKGLDLLAAYSDHSARYYNFSGAGVIWEGDHSLDSIIDEFLDFAGKVAVDEKLVKRRAESPPITGDVRVTFLTPGGFAYETASEQEMQRNRVGKVMLYLAVNLMKALIATANSQQQKNPG